MKRFFITAVAALALSGAAAQVIANSSAGSLTRSQMMYADRNYHGCLDNLASIDTRVLTPEAEQRVAYLRAFATLHISPEQAKLMFEEFLVKYPQSSLCEDVKMGIADCVYGHNYRRALELYDKINRSALSQARRDELDFRTAYCLLRTGSLEQAYVHFSAAVKSRQYANAANFYRGYIRFVQGDYAKARTLLESVKPGAPGDLAPLYLSQIYYMQGDYTKALATARKILADVPSDATAEDVAECRRVAGESLYRLGDTKAALPYIRQYVSAVAQPRESALYILGVEEYGSGNYSEALRLLLPVTGLDDAMGQSANLFVGQALMKESDYDGAIMAFDKALHMDHDAEVKEDAWYNYAVAHTKGGQVPFGSVVSTFKGFLRTFPDSRYAPKVQEFVINSYITDNNYQAALDGINEMISPSEATMAAKQQVLYVLGGRLLAGGETDRAAKLLDQAKSLARYSDQTDCEVTLLRGEAAYKLDDYIGAERRFKQYLSSASGEAQNRPLAQYDLGYALFAQKKYADAAKSFASAIDRPGQLGASIVADAWNRLGDCLYYNSDFAQAADAYRKAYDAHPASGDYALFQQALMEGYNRRFDDKIALLTRLEKDFPASPLIPDALLESTESYIRLGRNDRAIEVYRSLIERFPNTAQGRQGYLQMALTMLNSGHKTDALEAYKQVILKYPTSDEAAYAVAELKRISASDGTLKECLDFLSSVPDAPQVDPAEADTLTFDAAEQDYIEHGRTQRLEKYLTDYPSGTRRAQALSYLIEAARDASDTDKAYAYATEIVTRHPDSSCTEEALRFIAETDMDNGRGIAAMRSWEQLAQKASSPAALTTARMGIMRTARAIADYDRLLSASDAILSSTSTGADDRNEATYSKALALNHKGDNAAARKLWASIAGHTDELYGIRSAVALAANQLENNDLDGAEKTALSVTNSGSQHAYWVARAFIVLADVYTARGNTYKAQQFLRSLRENYPGDEPDLILMIEQRLEK